MLGALGLLTELGWPTNAAAVLFGRPGPLERHLPQCRLCVAHESESTAPTSTIERRDIAGNVFELVRFVERRVIEHLQAKPSTLGVEPHDVPVAAVREAVLNALAHRDYERQNVAVVVTIADDRIEVVSPGPLRFGLTPEMLHGPHAAQSPNPTIARAMYRSGLVRSWGSGFNRMAGECQAAGLDVPDVVESADAVTLTFMRHEPVSTHLG